MLVLRSFILFFLFVAELWVAQPKENRAYEEIKSRYAAMKRGDTAARPYIDLLISLAHREKNYAELTAAYLDAVDYEPSPTVKLQYADSAVAEAPYSCRKALVARAHMAKGKVYEYYFKAYRCALDSYIDAEPFARQSEDAYLQTELLYQFGLIYSYLDEIDIATTQFTQCVNFFRGELHKTLSTRDRERIQQDYFESLHQLVNCYQKNGDDETADRLIAQAERELPRRSAFRTVTAYFAKSKAISDYRKGHYTASMAALNRALPALLQAEDFAWISVVYFYLGKNDVAQQKPHRALPYFKKVDSVNYRHRFIFAELHETYAFLLNAALQKSNAKEVHCYSCRLRDSEFVSAENRHHLVARLEAARVTDEQTEKDDRHRKVLTGIFTLSFWLVAYTVNNILDRKQKPTYPGEAEDLAEAGDLLDTADLADSAREKRVTPKRKAHKQMITPETYLLIRQKLEKFEAEKGYLAPYLNLKKVAATVGTNANYLSWYLNHEKNVRFDRYLSGLRIHDIAGQIASDPAVAQQSAAQLSAACGIASPSNFRHLFFKFYGIPLWQYQQQCIMKFASENGDACI